MKSLSKILLALCLSLLLSNAFVQSLVATAKNNDRQILTIMNTFPFIIN